MTPPCYQIPYLRVLGGLTPFGIAAKLLREEAETGPARTANGFWQAVALIVVADFTLSLENVLAEAGASKGQLLPLALGPDDRSRSGCGERVWLPGSRTPGPGLPC